MVDDANPSGGTCCYDAIDKGIDNLLQVLLKIFTIFQLKLRYPNIILRIIALTDG